MWNNSGMDDLPYVLMFLGAIVGAAAVGLICAFVVYVWPWLKSVVHAATA